MDNVTFKQAKEAWENTEYGKVKNPNILDDFFNQKCVWKKIEYCPGDGSTWFYHHVSCTKETTNEYIITTAIWRYCPHCGREIEVKNG